MQEQAFQHSEAPSFDIMPEIECHLTFAKYSKNFKDARQTFQRSEKPSTKTKI